MSSINPKDFKASQIVTSKIIASGTQPASQPSLLVYSASSASEDAGGSFWG